jgi:uncharacterized protein YcbK (DUF882 family)
MMSDVLGQDFKEQQTLHELLSNVITRRKSFNKKLGVHMSTRSLSIAAAIAGFVALSVTGVEARPHNDTGPAAADRPSSAMNFKAKANNRTAYKARAKRTARNGKKQRYASKKGLKSRSFTKYASGGTSRSCLQPQARALLNRIEGQFGSVSIISTCRPGAVIATSGKPSKHRNGLAIDFDAGSRKGAIVSWLRQNHHSGGIMTYRDMSHIHVDIGPRFVSLGARSGRTG